MFSTRNAMTRFLSRAAVVASATPLLLVATTGCQRVQRPRPDRLSDAPLVVDEAMQIRDWDRSTGYYANGATVAGAPRVRFEPSGDSAVNYAADPLIALGNFVLIPVTYFRTPPFTAVEHHGAIVPPTHTAMPQQRVIE
jgi:hypothetical protein